MRKSKTDSNYYAAHHFFVFILKLVYLPIAVGRGCLDRSAQLVSCYDLPFLLDRHFGTASTPQNRIFEVSASRPMITVGQTSVFRSP
jgi:hypothetical protein